MGWVRTKALTMEQPSAPSLTRWLFAGVLMAIIGVLLFILHASGTVKILSVINIWWVSLMPAGCWLLIFCLRCYLWDRDLKAHQFLLKEAEYGQQRWEVQCCCRIIFLRRIGEVSGLSNTDLPAGLITFR